MIGKGREASAFESKRYIGIATCSLVAVNPDEKECEELGIFYDDQPITTVNIDDMDVPMAKIRFVMSVPDIDHKFNCTFNLRKRYRYNRDKTKAQVIDRFGRTAWGTVDDVRAKRQLMSSKGTPLNIDLDYRPAIDGEAGLTEFIKTFLMIPNKDRWDTAQGKFIPDPLVKPEDCMCRLETLDAIFKGDFSEITEAINAYKNNKIRIMFGVRNDMASGKIYQVFYQNKFSFAWSNNNKIFERELAGLTSANTEYGAYPLREYKVEATEIAPETEQQEEGPVNDLPF